MSDPPADTGAPIPPSSQAPDPYTINNLMLVKLVLRGLLNNSSACLPCDNVVQLIVGDRRPVAAQYWSPKKLPQGQ